MTILRHASAPTFLCAALLSAAASAQNANKFYVAEFSATPTLRVFDVDTGAVQSQVPLQLQFPTDFATAPDGTLYASTNTTLYRVDYHTGIATSVGPFGLSGVVGMEFTCGGGAVLVTASGQFASVNLSTGHAQILATFSVNFSGDVTTLGQSIFYAAYDRPEGSHLARLDLGAGSPTLTDLGVIAAGRRILGLDFDGFGRLIASDDAQPGRFYHISNLGGPISVTALATTSAAPQTGPVAGLASVVPSGEQVFYCSSSVNSCGTSPMLIATGVSSATASSGFTLTAVNVSAHKTIALFYSTSGQASIPFYGGTLCLQPPHYAAVLFATGTPGQCDGTVSIDFNAFARGLLPTLGTPQAFLSQPGTIVQCQFVGRDNPLPLLSQALEFSICE